MNMEHEIVPNTDGTMEAAIIWICDLNPKSVGGDRRSCRVVGVSSDLADILNAPVDDAIALVVPASHRFHP
jgi:hypothetical protein